jgi:predicted HAD superfamily Cof-like phosphohydrolase
LAFPIQQNVIDFHNKFGHPVRDSPENITEEEAVLAYGFIEEELDELQEALFMSACGEPAGCCTVEYNPDIVDAADALGDIVFTAYGFAARLGIDLDRVLAAICESNMSKTANGQNKILKGEDYFPPRITEALGLAD